MLCSDARVPHSERASGSLRQRPLVSFRKEVAEGTDIDIGTPFLHIRLLIL